MKDTKMCVKRKDWFNTEQRIRQEFMMFLGYLKYWWINLYWILAVTQATSSIESLSSVHEKPSAGGKNRGGLCELQMLLVDTFNDVEWILARLYNRAGNMGLKVNVDQQATVDT